MFLKNIVLCLRKWECGEISNRILLVGRKWKWKDLLKKFVYVYNCISNGVIGFFFFYLLFSCLLCFFINLILGLFCNEVYLFYVDYVKRWVVVMKEVYVLVMKNIFKFVVDGKM